MNDWDADPQRDAFNRAANNHSKEYWDKIQVYLKFARFVHHYDETGYSPHDDIDFVPMTLEELDGAEFPEQNIAVGRIAMIFIEPVVDLTDIDDWDEPPYYDPWDDYREDEN